MATFLRRTTGALTALLLTAFGVLATIAPASAEDGYRYWNYFHLQDGSWAFSQVGAAEYQPKDGDVEGFRYGTSTAKQGLEPRADLDEVGFEQVCAGEEKRQGQKRVAVLIDYGTVEDAAGEGAPPEPRAACAVVPADASTQDVLGEVAEVRVEGGLTCALDGYPASGCGVPVKNAQVPRNEQPVSFALPAAAQSAAEDTGEQTEQTEQATSEADPENAANQDDGGGNGLLLLAAVAAAIVLIGGGGYLFSRRNQG